MPAIYFSIIQDPIFKIFKIYLSTTKHAKTQTGVQVKTYQHNEN